MAKHFFYRFRHNALSPERFPKPDPVERTVGKVVDQYIGLCRVLSPTTVSGYEKIRRTGFPHLWDVPISELTPTSIQAAVNTEAMREGRRGRISPKTLANEWGLVSSSLWKICGLKYEVRLPQRVKKIREYPEPAAVMEAVRGSSVELPCLLALWLSFTMSEIRGLMWSDIQGDTITINRVMVDVDGVPTIKETGKTDARIRRHRLPAYLQQLLNETPHESDFVVPLNHSEIFGRFRRLCERQGIDLRFHDLRAAQPCSARKAPPEPSALSGSTPPATLFSQNKTPSDGRGLVLLVVPRGVEPLIPA